MPFKFTCPKCHVQNPLSDEPTSEDVVCSGCGSKFRVRRSRKDRGDSPPPPERTENGSETAATVQASAVPEDGVRILWGVGDVILGAYEVTSLVGDDLYGQAYRVWHRGWMADVHVKTPSPEILGRREAKESLSVEAERWASLGLHPNVVTCYHVRTLGGAPRIFAQWVDGTPLSQWMSSGRLYEGTPRQALERILDLGIQTARALHHAHGRSVSHGGIRPEEVMIEADLTTRVTHFCLIHTLDQARRSRRISKRNLGKMAPEQSAGENTSPRTDIWLFALMLADAAMGDTRWRDEVPEETALWDWLDQKMAEARTPLPDSLVQLLSHCLLEDPADRPLSIETVETELKGIYAETTGHAYPRAEAMPGSPAENLSNQGVSLWDKGLTEQAGALFDEAVGLDAACAPALYNQCLLMWRDGRMSYEGLLNQLESIATPWCQYLYQAQVAAEKKDPRGAHWLQRAAKDLPRPSPWARVLDTLQQAVTAGQDVTAPAALAWPPAVAVSTSGTEAAPAHDLEARLAAVRQSALEGQWKAAAEALAEAHHLPGAESSKALQAYQSVVARHQPREAPAGARLRFRLLGHSAPVLDVAVSLDNDVAVSASQDHTLKVWDLKTGSERHTLSGHGDSVVGVVVTPDGQMAASASADKTLRTWNLADGSPLKTLEHEDRLTALAMTPDGRVILTSSQDRTLRVWNASTGRCLQTLEGHQDSVMGVAISADGRVAASVSLDKTVKLWDLATGDCNRTLEGHREPVWGLALTPDGRYLVSSSDDRSIRVWETETGKQVAVMRGHTDSVGSVEITPDARFVVSGSHDRTVRIWNLQGGQCLQSLGGHAAPVNAVAVSMDGRRVLSASADHSIEVWELTWSLLPHDEGDWDPQAATVLSTILQIRLKRRAGKRAAVSGDEFEKLLTDMAGWGFGWLSWNGIKTQIEQGLGVTVTWWEPSEALQEALKAELSVFEADAVLPDVDSVATVPPPPVAEPAKAAPPPPPPEPEQETTPEPEPVLEPVLEPEPVLAAPPLPVPEPATPVPASPEGMLAPPAALAAPELRLAEPVPIGPLDQLAPELNTPLLLGPDGELDVTPAPLGLPGAPALLPPEPLAPLGLGLLPPPVAPQPVKSAPTAVATEEKPAAMQENGKATEPPAAEAKAPPPPLPPPPPPPAPMPATPAAPVPKMAPAEAVDESKLGPIKRAELEAARRRAKAVAPPPEAPAEPTRVPSAAPTEEEKPQLKPRKTIHTAAESLIKLAKQEAAAPALAGAPEITLKMRRQEDVWEVGDSLLDLYQVTQFLGEGTMGKVYEVLHPGWNIELAMRTPRAAIHANPAALERWLAEAQRWADLGVHPHIVQCHYARTAHDIPRIFMEHVESGTLGSWIHSGKLYDGGHDQAMQRILDVAIQVARGLAYAHSKDLIHQDVKPANVLMTADGTAKVSDFGLGRSWDGTLDEEVLPPGRELLTNIGGMTPAYASPEQVAKQPLTPATDVWSWGLLVMEMFAGEVTWSNGKMASKALSDYELYGAENADIPPMPEAVSEVLQRCFKEKPAERWASLLDIVKEFIALYPDLTGTGYPRLVVEENILQAATINNRALAAADLGFPGKMDEMLDEALALNPDSQHLIFNRGLTSLRSGNITFEALMQALESAKPSPGNSWELGYLKAWLHIERGEEQDARRLLTQAHREAFNDPDGDHAIARAADLARAYNANMSVLTAHGSPAWGVDLTDDNAFAISASDDSTLRVWDVSTGRCIRLLEGHTAAVFSVALTPEGHVAISGGEDMTVRVWNVGIGEAVHILEGHEDSVTGVVSSERGKNGASCSMDGSVRLWDIESGYCTKTLKAESGAPLTALAASGNMHVVVAAEEGGDIQVWDTQSGHLQRTLKGHEEKVEAVAVTREGTLAVSASDDGTLRVWDLRNGHTTHILEGHHGWVNGVALTPDGSLCISAGWDKTLRVWDVSTGRCLYTLTGHENHIRGVALNPDGTQAVSVAIDGAMGFWKLPEELAQAPRTLIRARASGHREVDRDAFVAAVEAADTLNQEEQWQVATESLNRSLAFPGYEFSPVAVALSGVLAHHAGRGRLRGVWTSSIIETRNRTMRGLTLSANGRLAITPNGNRSIQVWDRETGKLIRDLKGHDGAVQDVALTHDGVTAVSASADQTVKVWNLPRSECVDTLSGHVSAVWTVACAPDATLIVSGGWDDTVRLWTGGKCQKVMKGHDGPVLAVALSPDGKLVASGSADHTVRIWEVASGRCVRTLEGHDDLVSTVCFVGDGMQVLSGSNDHSLRLWDIESGKSAVKMAGHRQPVCSAAVSLDGRTVVSGSWDWTLRVWELPSGRALRILDGHLGAVRGVGLDADGRQGVSVSEDGSLRQWQFDWAIEPRAEADWDEGARVFVSNMAATLRRRSGGKAVRPTQDDMDELMQALSQSGYGWLRPAGVEAELSKLLALLDAASPKRTGRDTGRLPNA